MCINPVEWGTLQGADGSFLLLSKPGKTSEKDSHSQVGMRNEKYVNNIKDAVEKICPGVVSCADVLAVGGAAAVEVVRFLSTPAPT